MHFFCYLYGDGGAPPYMEVITAGRLSQVEARVRRLMTQHRAGTYAEVFQNDERVMRIPADLADEPA